MGKQQTEAQKHSLRRRYVVTTSFGDDHQFPTKGQALQWMKDLDGLMCPVKFFDRHKGVYLDPVSGATLAKQMTQ
jgi:hypothetical protein